MNAGRSVVDMATLAAGVARALTTPGETWTLVPLPEGVEGRHYRSVRRTEDGAGVYLSHDEYGGRLRIGGEWPEGDGFRPYKQEHITVSVSRAWAAIAGDIRRRFFPWYLPQYAAMRAQGDECKRRDEAARQLAGELAAIFGGTVYKPDHGRNGGDYLVQGCPASCSVAVAVYGGKVRFTVEESGERARALARFLAAPVSTGERTESDRAYIDAARRLYAMRSDNDVEVDDNAVVSEGETGAFVAAWVHVRREDAPLAGEYDAEDGEVAP